MNKILISIAMCTGLMVLAACASPGSQQSSGDLTGQVWALTELLGKAPVADTGISAQFNSDGCVKRVGGMQPVQWQIYSLGQQHNDFQPGEHDDSLQPGGYGSASLPT